MSRNISAAAIVPVATVALLLGSYPARGQETLEQRYLRAVELFNQPDVEGACLLLRAIERESPGYKETKRYLNPACAAMERLQAREEKLYGEGVQFFRQGNYDDAREKFEEARKIQLSHPKYPHEIGDYLKKIEERKFQLCVDTYRQERLEEAKTCFTRLVETDSRRATEASKYLAKIADNLRATELLNNGTRLAKEGKYAEAQSNFEQVIRKGGAQSARARTLLAQVKRQAEDRASRTPAGAQSTSPIASISPAAEQWLRGGLQAYFEGNFISAEQNLTEYLNRNGSKQDLARFFLGVVHSARYYLSGEKDSQEKAQALDSFRFIKQNSKNFHPPEKYVSPKILSLYAEANSSAAP